MNLKNRVLIDWFSASFQLEDPSDLMHLLGFPLDLNFTDIHGMYGYANRKYSEGISVHYERDDGTCWLEMSGKGCRAWEQFKGEAFEWIDFFHYVLAIPELKNITRLDVAYDDFDGLLDIEVMTRDFLARNYVSKLKWWKCELSCEGTTLYHGSPKSDVRIRIYDKGREQGVDYQWTRIEFQLRDDRARCFMTQLLLSGSLADTLLGVLLNYLRYVMPSSDTNRSRAPLMPYWQKLCGEVAKVSIFEKLGVDYDLSDLRQFVIDQAGGAISTLIKVVGSHDFLIDLFESRKDRELNPKHSHILGSYPLKIGSAEDIGSSAHRLV